MVDISASTYAVRLLCLYEIGPLKSYLGGRSGRSSIQSHRPSLMLFSVPRDGNQGLENAIFRPWRTENKELRSLFSVPGGGHLAYSMLFSVLGDGNHGLEKASFRPWRTENKELCSLFSVPGDGHLALSMTYTGDRESGMEEQNGNTKNISIMLHTIICKLSMCLPV